MVEAISINKHNIIVKGKSPDWHEQILNERLGNYKTGKSKATSWNAFESELNREDEANCL